MRLTLKHDISSVIHDPAFIRWVTNPTKESDCYWGRYLLKNPDKRIQAFEARFLIKLFRVQEEPFNKTEESELWNKIVHLKSRRQWRLLFYYRFKMLTSIIYILSFHSQRSKKVFVDHVSSGIN